jgi:hypothetical protein
LLSENIMAPLEAAPCQLPAGRDSLANGFIARGCLVSSQFSSQPKRNRAGFSPCPANCFGFVVKSVAL